MKNLKKVLSLILAISMVMSLCTFVFAEGETTQAEMQIDGGATAKYYDAAGSEYTGDDRIVKNNDDGQVTVKETITPTGTENLFNIELEVTTKEEARDVELPVPAAVTLVIDLSGSMNYCATCGSHSDSDHVTGHTFVDTGYTWNGKTYGVGDGKCDYRSGSSRCNETENMHHAFSTRLAAAKSAAISFLNKYAANANGGSRYVSIVTYGDSATTRSLNGETWIDVSDPDNLEYLTGSNVVINRLTAGGSSRTNTDDGLKKAQATLTANDTVKDIEKKFVVLLTDGEPNKVSTTNTSSNNNYKSMKEELAKGLGDGYNTGYTPDSKYRCTDQYAQPAFLKQDGENNKDYDYYVYSRPAQRAYYIKNTLGATFYSIGLSLSKKASDWLTAISSGSNGCVSASDAETLATAFDTIVSQITSSVDPWTVTVPMGNHIVFASETDDKITSFANNTLTWDLRKDIPAAYDTTAKKYTYKLNYQIKLDVAGMPDEDRDGTDTPWVSKYFKTNGAGETILNYCITEKNEQGEIIKYFDNDGEEVSQDKALMTLKFNVPAVRGFKADLHFTKVDAEDKKPLNGAKFDLVCDTMNGDTPIWESKDNTGSNGVFSFPQSASAPKMPSGEIYTLTETKAPTGYLPIAPMKLAVKYGVVCYEDGTPVGDDMKIVDSESIDVPFTKVWAGDDATNRPAVKVALLQNSELMDGKVITLTAADVDSQNANVWKGSFTGVPKVDAQGNEYTYTVQELDANDKPVADGGKIGTYTVAYNGNQIINYVQNDNVVYSVQKEWVKLADENPTVKFILKADGTPVETVTLPTEDGYQANFKPVSKYSDRGELIVYTVEETCPNGYECGLPVQNGTTFTFKNTLKQAKISVSGTKSWVGAPAETVVQLYADGIAVEGQTKTLNAETGWNYSFTELDKYVIGTDSATEITYTVKETVGGEAVADGAVITLGGVKYQVNYSGNNITNTELTDITVNKVWIDVTDFSGEHEQPKVQLTSSAGYAEEMTMSGDECTFINVPKYNADGTEIEYSVTETYCPDGYECTDIDNDTFTITNTFSDTLDITVNKFWKDPTGSKDETATFTLYRKYLDKFGAEQTEQVGEPKTITSDGNNNGSCTFKDLDEYYTYVKLTPVEAPAPAEEPDDEGTAEGDVPEAGELEEGEPVEGEPVEEEPADEGTADEAPADKAPAAEPEYTESEPELCAYVYYVVETSFTGDYSQAEPVVNGNIWNFTNTILPGTTKVTVNKTWDLPSDKSATAYFDVYEGSVADANLVDTITITSSQTSGISKDLPKYEDGVEITYVVKERALPGFDTEDLGNNSFRNTFNDTETDLTVQKIWVDGKTPAERPAVTLQLTDNTVACGTVTFSYDNGVQASVKFGDAEATAAEVNVSDDQNTYTVVLEDMVRYEKTEDGWVKHVYGISETTALTDYNALPSVSEDNNTLSVLNKHISDLTITKTWLDAGDTTRPEIKLTLTGESANVKNTYTIVMKADSATMDGEAVAFTNSGNQWKVTIPGSKLPEYDSSNQKITYTVAEDETALEGTGYALVSTSGRAITNALDPEKVEKTAVSGTKTWAEVPDEGVTLPEKVEVELYMNGGTEPVDTTYAEPDDEGNWSYEFTDLDKYTFTKDDSGNIIAVTLNEYTVKEAGVTGGSVMFGADKYAVSYDGFNITNTYEKTFVYKYKVVCTYVHMSWNGETISNSGEVEREQGTGEKDEVITKNPAAYTDYNGETYTYDTSKENVPSVTLEEDGIVYVIELNYILTDPAPYIPPEEPNYPPYTPPVTPPEEPETPPEEPEEEEIVEEEVPLSGFEVEEFEEEEVPLANVPRTNSTGMLWLACAACSGLGLGVLNFGKRKEEDEDEE